MPPPSARRASKYAVATAFISLFLWSGIVQAQNPIITEPTDFWFEYTEQTQFIAETHMIEGHSSDPQLWLYDEQNTLLISNDDYMGLQSYISIEVLPGKYRLRAGTCCWEPDVWRTGGGWNIDYELSFNGNPASTTTLESLPTTTSPPTTTTEVPTTTTSTTTTTEVATTTTLLPTTTSTSTTTTTVVPTTTTEVPVAPTEPPTTTTSSTSTTSTIPVQTTSTTTTVLPTTTTMPVTTTTTTTLPAVPVIPLVITASQATEIATNPEALATATAEQATEVFQSLELDTLTDTQLNDLVIAVQAAPAEVRQAFEETINIFGGKADSYIPLGSTIPVRQRRALIVITTVMFAAPIVSRKKW